MQLKEGSELQNGKYRIIRVLGQGGFGITYLAELAMIDKMVAIKEFFPSNFCVRDSITGFVILPPELNKHKNKFISEAKKLAQLNHKGIVKVIETFEENGTAYYVMDYIAGQSLWEIIQQKQFTVKESLLVIGKVSRALAHIHSKRMLHLDIKPMNIMIRNEDNEPIIIDFGISKTFDAKGNPNTTFLPAASPGYSPAEQFTGEVNKFAPQLDIYSLGATLYTLLTGIVPTYPTPLTVSKLTFDAAIPFHIVKAVKTAMAYKTEDRYPTVKDFLIALDLVSTSSSKKSSVADPKTKIDKPIIKSFGIKTEAPYYVGENLELSWWVNNCERVYLNGQLQSGVKKIKKVKYESPGNKRFTLKAVKGEEEVSMTRSFEVIKKIDLENERNSISHTDYQKHSQEKISKQEETKVIIADIVKKKPEIVFFKRVGNEQIYIGDKVKVYWDVMGADELVIDNWFIPIKPNSAEIRVRNLGTNAITLTARNSAGAVSKTLNVKAERRPEPPNIKKFGFNKKDKVFVGDTITIEWRVEYCRELRLNRDDLVPAIGSKTITFEREGSYAYTLRATNKDGIKTKTINIVVHRRTLSNNNYINNNNVSGSSLSQSLQNNKTNKDNQKESDVGCFLVFGKILICGIIMAIMMWTLIYIVTLMPSPGKWILLIGGFFGIILIGINIGNKWVKY